MQIVRYIPNYFDTETKVINEFNTLEELREIEWIKTTSEIPDFKCFLIKERQEPETHSTLLAMFKNGHCFPIGFLTELVPGMEVLKTWAEIEQKKGAKE